MISFYCCFKPCGVAILWGQPLKIPSNFIFQIKRKLLLLCLGLKEQQFYEELPKNPLQFYLSKKLEKLIKYHKSMTKILFWNPQAFAIFIRPTFLR
jgi:hypothetical protein